MKQRTFYSRMALAWIVTGVTFMELLDTSILNTAIPVIAQAVGTNVFEMKTAITAYLAALAIFIPISGWVADVLGTKRTIMSAILLFTASSLACGLSHSLEQLIFFRILQGIGGAMMTPVSRLILVRLFQGEELAKAAGLVAIPILFGPIMGPVLGGYITTNFHWSWIFFINVPIGAVAIVLIGLKLENEVAAVRPPFDLTGFLFAGLGLSLLSFSLENADNPLFPKWLTALLIAGGITLTIKLVAHCKKSTTAVFDFSLFRLSTFKDGIAMLVIGVVATSGLQLLLPVLFQLEFGMTPLRSGLLTFSVAVGSVLLKPFIVPISNRAGYPRTLAWFPVTMAAAVFSFCLIKPGVPHWLIITLLFAYGACFSFLGNLINVVPYIEVESARTSRAISLQSTLFQFSISLGVSLSSLMLGGFLDILKARLGDAATRTNAVSAFHLCFVVIGCMCVALAANNTRFKENQFAGLAGKNIAPAGE